MKNVKSLILGLVLLTIAGVAKASGPSAVTLTKNYVVNTYVDAMTRGKLNGMGDILDVNAKFSQLRGKQVLSFSKAEMMDYLKLNKDLKQDCTISTSVVQNDADVAVVKVDMKFKESVRSNYLTMVNTGDGWKITNVYSVFK
jgi:hypothetical protein